MNTRHEGHTAVRRVTVATVATVMIACAACCLVVSTSPAGAQPPSSIRMGHFSPDTAAMDVYLVPFDGGPDQLVLPGLGYGQVSEYMSLSPNVYNFALRPAGTPSDAPAQLTLSAQIEGSSAYTFAALGENKSIETRLLNDDLTPPPSGAANVRLIHASTVADAVDVRVTEGPVLASGIGFAGVTGYAPVPAGNWQVEVSRAGTAATEAVQSLAVEADTINTVVVLNEGTDRLRLVSVVDATGMGLQQAGTDRVLPAGGIATGAGGTAQTFRDDATDRVTPSALLIVGIAVVVLLFVSSTRLRRPLPSRR